jgi:hypothetical protein
MMEDDREFKNLDAFMCEKCPLMEECPFDGEWEDCKINDLINEYEAVIAEFEEIAEADDFEWDGIEYYDEEDAEIVDVRDLLADISPEAVSAYDEYMENNF